MSVHVGFYLLYFSMSTNFSFLGRPQDNFAAQLVSQGNKDILFTDYNRTLKAMRKIAHGALKAYGDGLVELEQSVLEEAEALFKRFELRNGVGFDPRNDLGKSHGSKASYFSAMLMLREVCAWEIFVSLRLLRKSKSALHPGVELVPTICCFKHLALGYYCCSTLSSYRKAF